LSRKLIELQNKLKQYCLVDIICLHDEASSTIARRALPALMQLAS